MANTALVLGNGRCALEVAGEVLKSGVDVILATPGAAAPIDIPSDALSGRNLTLLEKSVVTACRGTVGNFSVSLRAGGQPVTHQVGAIVIAEPDVVCGVQGLYDLRLSDSVVPLSRLSAVVDDLAAAPADLELLDSIRTAVLISGLAGESTPAIAGRVMETAVRLQSGHDIQTFVLAGNLKVAAEGLESLYRKAKAAGTVFFKFDATSPRFRQSPGGKVRIEFEDPIMGNPCRLSPDLCVVDEAIFPSPELARLAQVLELQPGPDGFIQTDNVHRQTVFTPRKGIFAVGPARCAQSVDDHRVDARNAALAVFGVLNPAGSDPFPKADIDPGSCIRCLTCFRLCPYRAIEVATRVSVAPEACEGCGICVAECPRKAIRIEGLSRKEIVSRLKAAGPFPEKAAPRMVAFCCSRSAAEAARQAACAGYELPAGLTLVEVPCAGGISLDHLLGAYQDKADGVLVLTCHTDNCHSERGNRHARMRVAHLSDQMPMLGLDPRRLLSASLAANMGREFADIVCGFEIALVEMGPIKKGKK